MTSRDAARKEERRSRMSIRAGLALLTTALAPSLAWAQASRPAGTPAPVVTAPAEEQPRTLLSRPGWGGQVRRVLS